MVSSTRFDRSGAFEGPLRRIFRPNLVLEGSDNVRPARDNMLGSASEGSSSVSIGSSIYASTSNRTTIFDPPRFCYIVSVYVTNIYQNYFDLHNKQPGDDLRSPHIPPPGLLYASQN